MALYVELLGCTRQGATGSMPSSWPSCAGRGYWFFGRGVLHRPTAPRSPSPLRSTRRGRGISLPQRSGGQCGHCEPYFSASWRTHRGQGIPPFSSPLRLGGQPIAVKAFPRAFAPPRQAHRSQGLGISPHLHYIRPHAPPPYRKQRLAGPKNHRRPAKRPQC